MKYLLLLCVAVIGGCRPVKPARTAVEGFAHDAKAGATVITADNTVYYIDGLAKWDSETKGERIRVTGFLEEIKNDPINGDEQTQQITGTQYIIKNADWWIIHGKSITDTAQEIKISEGLTAKEGEFYLDSIKVDMSKIYLDPDNIKNIRAFTGEKAKIYSHSGSVTLITRKNPVPLVLIQEMVDNYKRDTLKDVDVKVNVVIDGNLISEPLGAAIEASTILEISILRDSKEGPVRDPRAPTIIIRTKNQK